MWESCEKISRILWDIVNENNYNIATSNSALKNTNMKKVKKDVASFSKLNAPQMSKINGGGWVEVTNSDGTVTRIWV